MTRNQLGWLLFAVGVLLQILSRGWPLAAVGLAHTASGLTLLIIA